MIAADTSTWAAFFAGEEGTDVSALTRALGDEGVVMAPVVLTELLSAPRLTEKHRAALAPIPLMAIEAGYWERAGALRCKVLSRGRKARLGDALIAQSCLDHAVPLLTRDRDYLAFVAAAGLKALVNLQP